ALPNVYPANALATLPFRIRCWIAELQTITQARVEGCLVGGPARCIEIAFDIRAEVGVVLPVVKLRSLRKLLPKVHQKLLLLRDSAGDFGGIAMGPDFRSVLRRPEAVGKVGLEASKFTIQAPNELKVKEGLFVGRKIQIEERAETVFACLHDT